MARKPGGGGKAHKAAHHRANNRNQHRQDESAVPGGVHGAGRGGRFPGGKPPRGSRFFFGSQAAVTSTCLPVPESVPAEMLFNRPPDTAGHTAYCIIRNEAFAEWTRNLVRVAAGQGPTRR